MKHQTNYFRLHKPFTNTSDQIGNKFEKSYIYIKENKLKDNRISSPFCLKRSERGGYKHVKILSLMIFKYFPNSYY